jgi:hypothetical protein
MLENAEARDLVARMKLETLAEGKKRFGDSGKTIVEYFKTFQKVIASATDNGGNQLHPRNWSLAFIDLPKVNKRKQHCPTLTADEITHIVANAKGKYRVAAAYRSFSHFALRSTSRMTGARCSSGNSAASKVAASWTPSKRQHPTGTSTSTLRSLR